MNYNNDMKNIILKRRVAKEITSSILTLQAGDFILIEGLPNVGKTSLISHICDNLNLAYRYFDLQENGQKGIPLSDKKIDDGIKEASSNRKKSDKIIIFDHINKDEEAIKRLKEESDKRFAYILISDHESALKEDIKDVKTFQIKPLDFHEFLLNLGIDTDDLPSFYRKKGEKQALNELNGYLFDYFITGGFPSVVSLYLNGVNRKRIRKRLSAIESSLRSSLIETFLDGGNTLLKRGIEVYSCLSSYYQEGFPQFKYSALHKTARASSYLPAINILNNYGYLRLSSRYERSLTPSKEDFRLFPPDIGLFSIHIEEKEIIRLKEKGFTNAPSAYLEALLGDALSKNAFPFGYLWDFRSHEKIDLLAFLNDQINLYKTNNDRKNISVYSKMADNRNISSVYSLASKDFPSPFRKTTILEALLGIKGDNEEEETISLDINPDELF